MMNLMSLGLAVGVYVGLLWAVAVFDRGEK